MPINQIQTPPVYTPSADDADGFAFTGIQTQDGQVYDAPSLSQIPQQTAKFFANPVQSQLLWINTRLPVEIGTVELVDGEATVTTANVTPASIIMLTPQVLAGASVAAALTVGAIVDGVSFDITSADVTDESTIAYVIYAGTAI